MLDLAFDSPVVVGTGDEAIVVLAQLEEIFAPARAALVLPDGDRGRYSRSVVEHVRAHGEAILVREPQVREAEARLAAARADLAAAELSLERTHLSLPFDGLVLDEQVDVSGQAPSRRPAMSDALIRITAVPTSSV